MSKLEVIYYIIDKNSPNQNIDNIPGYFFEVEESLELLTKENIKEFLSRDGIEKKYLFNAIIEYDLLKKDEKSKKDYKPFEKGSKLFDQVSLPLENDSEYSLYLKVKIDVNDNLDKEKKLSIKEKEKKKNKELLSKINLIDEEINDFQKQIKAFRNSDIYYTAIKKIKNSLYPKKMLEKQYQNQKGGTQVEIKNNLLTEEQIKIKNSQTSINKRNCKLFFWYSSPLKLAENDFCQEDDSYNKQWLNIYKKFKEKKLENNIYLRQINQTISNDLNDEDDFIFHIRADSICENNEIYLGICNAREIYAKYELDRFIEFHGLLKKKNLKLLIISSDNLDKIKKKFDKISNSVNIIYINHPNKYNFTNENEFEEKLRLENLENKFLDEFYEYLIAGKIRDVERIFNSDEYKDILKYSPKDFKQVSFRNVNKIKANNDLKNYILNYDSIKNYYYPIIGHEKILAQSIQLFKANPEITICIYGEKGIGKKCLAKKIGISLLQKNIVGEIIFLDIYGFEMNYSKIKDKIKIMRNKISKNYNGISILLIIYFNDTINEENLKSLLNEIKRQKKFKKYLFVFSFNNFDKKVLNLFESEKKEFQDTFELTDKIISNKDVVKDLYNYFFSNYFEKEFTNFEIIDKIYKADNYKNKMKISNIFLFLTYINLFPGKANDIINCDNREEIFKAIINFLTSSDLGSLTK